MAGVSESVGQVTAALNALVRVKVDEVDRKQAELVALLDDLHRSEFSRNDRVASGGKH